MEERGQSNSTGQHKLILQNRKSGSFTGVTDVVNYDANEIILDTELGRLTIKGKELHVNRLDLQKKEVEIDGTVDMLQYSGTPGRGVFGMIAFAAYDGIRVVRRIFPHGIFMISLEDLVYWMVISVCFFLHLCQVNNGKIRGYVLLGSLLGAWIYYSFCSRFVMRYLTEKIHYLKKRLKKFREMTTIKLNKLRKRKKPEESEKEHEKN